MSFANSRLGRPPAVVFVPLRVASTSGVVNASGVGIQHHRTSQQIMASSRAQEQTESGQMEARHTRSSCSAGPYSAVVKIGMGMR